jgi:hypothetical protein
VSASDTVKDSLYTSKDKEFYLSTEALAFVRPGLEINILDVAIPADRKTEVLFSLTDPAGLQLDRTGVATPGPVSTSFILAFIPEGEEAYVAYTTRVQTSPITGDSAVQASADSGGVYTDMGDGTYMYKFRTEVPADYDMNATHTLGVYGRRDLTEFELNLTSITPWNISYPQAAAPRCRVTSSPPKPVTAAATSRWPFTVASAPISKCACCATTRARASTRIPAILSICP